MRPQSDRLVGIVSRALLLTVFTRPDQAIRSEIMDDVIVADFMMDPTRFVIHVDDGPAHRRRGRPRRRHGDGLSLDAVLSARPRWGPLRCDAGEGT
jgi:hypothetical protein